MKIGDLVRFAHESNGGPVHRVIDISVDGMIDLNDMGGWFAPHLFKIADDIAAIPPSSRMTQRISDERLAEIEQAIWKKNWGLVFDHMHEIAADLRDEREKVAELEKTLDKIATAMGTTREALIKDANSTEPPVLQISQRVVSQIRALHLAQMASPQSRDDIIEQCAKVAESYSMAPEVAALWAIAARQIAAAIRALKAKQ